MTDIPDFLRDYTRKCQYCDELVVWSVENVDDPISPRIPMDVRPQDNGNMTLTVIGEGRSAKVRIGRPTALAAKGMLAAGVPLFLRHALLCVNAARWSSNTTGFSYGKSGTKRMGGGTSSIRSARVKQRPRKKG